MWGYKGPEPIPAGWSVNCTVTPNSGYCGEVWASRNGIVNGGQCGLQGQAMIFPNYATSAALFAALGSTNTAARTIIVGQHFKVGGGCDPSSASSRQRYLRIYHKPAGVPNGSPSPQRDPQFWPHQWPVQFPFAPPGAVPAPAVSPGIAPTPMPDPFPQTERGPSPTPRPSPRPRPGGRPRPGDRPRPIKYPAPGIGVVPVPGGTVQPGTPPVGSVIVQTPGQVPGAGPKDKPQEKPRKGEKEVKVRAQVAKSALYKVMEPVFSNVTETMDFIGALYKALPWCVRPVGYVGPEKMAETLFREWQYLDLRKALGNIAAMQVEDRVIGELSRKLGAASASMGFQYNVGGQSVGLGEDAFGESGMIPISGDLVKKGIDAIMPYYDPPVVPKERCAKKWRDIKAKTANKGSAQ